MASSANVPSPDETEYQYLTYFQTKTVPAIAGCFDSDVWGNMVQACQEGYGKHAAIALGAIHKSCMWRLPSASEGQDVNERARVADRVHAIEQYSKSLQYKRQFRQDEDSQEDLRDTLVSCLLTIYFEMLCSESYVDSGGLVEHVEGAVNILRQFLGRKHGSQLLSTYMLPSLDLELINTITRLDNIVYGCLLPVQAAGGISRDYSWFNTTLGDAMPEFPSIKVARLYWDLLERRTIQWRPNIDHHVHPPTNTQIISVWSRNILGDAPNGVATPPSDQISEYVRDLSRWNSAFEGLYLRCCQSPNTTGDFQSAAILKVKYLTSRNTYPDPYLIPALQISYRPITDIVRFVLQTLSCPIGGEPNPKASFSIDDHFLSALFAAAIEGEDRNVRKGAVQLMHEYPRIEGIWETRTTAAVAEWVLSQEKSSQMGEIIGLRLEAVRRDINKPKGTVLVQCSQVLNGSRVLMDPVSLKW